MATELHRPAREVQALAEVGVTEVSRQSSVLLVVVFVVTIFGVAFLEPFVEPFDGDSGRGSPTPNLHLQSFLDFGTQARAAWHSVGKEGPLEANRALLAAMTRWEERLEEQSFLRRGLLPRLQWRLAAVLGLGNEQVYIGNEEWLFFRADVDFVIGRGFLEPGAQAARRLGGETWQPVVEPDPLPALVELQSQLRSRGIHLVVLPTPVKPEIEPDRLSIKDLQAHRAIHNPSYIGFLRLLQEQEIEVLDPAPLLVEARLDSGESQYLRTDTHWSPTAVERTARELAKRIRPRLGTRIPEPQDFRLRSVVVEGLGDIAAMLWLPREQPWLLPERVTTRVVVGRDGKIWKARRDSQVLLLGDSFSNVYYDPALGWGAGAGLGEQLAFHLQQSVDKLAVNAGGALQVRLGLQRVLATDEDRLHGKKVLVYQFAARELAQGDWRRVDLGVLDAANR